MNLLFPLLIAGLFFFSHQAFAEGGACQIPPKKPEIVCEEGGAFLCVNSPPGGVKEGFVILKGRLNLESSVLGEMSVTIQHEYTKLLNPVPLSKPLKEDCWEVELTRENNFCLDGKGFYSMGVPLDEVGPYTIFVTASRLQGSTQQRKVRTSYVIPPTLTPDVLHYEPDIFQGNLPPQTRFVQVTLDLLEGCGEAKESCDFIGASTEGVLVSIENKIAASPKKILCETKVSQGGAGKFIIGVPLEPGGNQLKITVCNAATGFQPPLCPGITPPPILLGGTVSKIEILSPLAGGPLLWDAARHATVSLRFKIAGYQPPSCDESVAVFLNSKGGSRVCANSEGIFETPLQPLEGYNIAKIVADLPGGKLLETHSFGWGIPLTPFDENGGVRSKEEWTLQESLRLWFSKKFLNGTLIEKLDPFLTSGNFGEWLSQITSSTFDIGGGGGGGNGDSLARLKEEVLRELDYCSLGGARTEGLRLEIREEPKIGEIRMEPFLLKEDYLETSISAKNVSLAIEISRDQNGDGKPDVEPLPIKIVFKELKVTPVLKPLQKKEKTFWILSSPHTDCAYKREGACLKRPSLLVPKQFKGGANQAGAFVVCDRSKRISEKMDKICHALNVVDRQTGGLLQEKILDALNDAYACGGTATLNALFREGFPIQERKGSLEFKGSVGVEEIQIEEGGILFSLKSRFGDEEMLEDWPEDLRLRGAGILIGAENYKKSGLEFDGGEGLILDMALPVLSQLFWGVRSSGGDDFSFELNEEFFEKVGFDFDEDCEIREGKKKHALCNIRPRAQEIFGGVISDYGYLNPYDPLRMTLTPSKAFPLRIAPLDSQGKVLFEFADWELAIASEKVPLVTARFSLKLVAYVTKPVPISDPALENPDHYLMTIRPILEESRWWITEIPGTNTTIIPGPELLLSLDEKPKLAIDHFSKNEIKIPIPRFIEFEGDSLFAKLGLSELTWGYNGFELQWNHEKNRLRIKLAPLLE